MNLLGASVSVSTAAWKRGTLLDVVQVVLVHDIATGPMMGAVISQFMIPMVNGVGGGI